MLLLADIRIALRQFARKPALALAVVAILALGIGANVSVFTLAWNLLYRPLPFGDPDRLVRIWGESRDGRATRLGFSIPKLEHFSAGQQSFSGVAVDVGTPLTFTAPGRDPEQIPGRRVSANYFDVLGVPVLRGRGFRSEEEAVTGAAVVTDTFWRTRLDASADAVGSAIPLDGTPYTIVGIVPAPPSADGATDVYITRPYETGLPRPVLMRGVSFMRLSARLREGVSFEQARANTEALAATYLRDNAGNADADWIARITTIREDLSGNFRLSVMTLLWAVGLVLLLACCNVANLMTAHLLSRARELAVRTSLGARRWQLLRQCVVETTALSGAGAAAGLFLAAYLTELLPRLGANLPIDSHGIAGAPLFAACALAVVVGVATGVLPGVQASRMSALDALRGARGTVGGRSMIRSVLVGVQVAVSLLLLFGAVLLIGSFRRVSAQDPGFAVSHVATGTISLPARRYPDPLAQATMYERLREELGRAPGVRSAAIVAGLPLSGLLSRAPYVRADRVVPLNQRPLGPTRSVTPDYFTTMGIPLRAGRDFTPRDDAAAPPVVILSAAAASRLFPNEDPLGRVILSGSQNGGIPVEIVGIVADVRSLTLTQPTDVEIYRPFAQRTQAFGQLVVKAEGAPASVLATIRTVVRAIDPELPVTQLGTLEQVLDSSLGQRRLLMTLLAAFAAVAFVLSAVGIYAVVSFTVGGRTSEIGLRIALGANPSSVIRLVAAHGMRPVLAGAAAGLLSVPLVARALSTQLFEVSAADPRVLGSVAAIVIAGAAAASVIPARRAARIDPIVALRRE
jgi:putative ABC transport system permease protein